jgi:acetoin utilization deacetylase AcuC-like enzyme
LTLFYGSTHEKDNYPGTGRDPSPFVGDKAKSPRDRRIVNRTLEPGPKSRSQFKEKWLEILAEMELFQPDLVLISAGT